MSAVILSLHHIIEAIIQRTLSKICSFENKYNFTTYALLKQEKNGSLDDDNLSDIEKVMQGLDLLPKDSLSESPFLLCLAD